MTFPFAMPAVLSKLPWGYIVLIGGALAAITVHSCSIDRAEERGAVQQDTIWQAGQDKADAIAATKKAVTEHASKAVSLRTGENYDRELEDLRRRYAALRDSVRRQGGNSAAGAGNRGRQGSATGQADEAASGQQDHRQAEIERLRQHLIDVAQEGDIYRQQVIDLQAWIIGQAEAEALGRAVK